MDPDINQNINSESLSVNGAILIWPVNFKFNVVQTKCIMKQQNKTS